MVIKYIFVIILLLLLLISISQIFSIPPFADDVFNTYKSGYFSELERGFGIIKDSFINIKVMRKPVLGWIFLKDIGKKHDIDIKVYDRNGYEVVAPGKKGPGKDNRVRRLLNSLNPQDYSEVMSRKFYHAIPFFLENKCKFCHDISNKSNIIGVITFNRKYDSHIYYSSERVIIFIIFSIIISIIIYFVMRWNPGKKVKELFDKF